MKRLTEKRPTPSINSQYQVKAGVWTADCIEKLGKYEDDEENGLILRLPCRVGSTVYCIYERYTQCSAEEQEFDEYRCQGCICENCDSELERYIQKLKVGSIDWLISNRKQFGKTIFLTKEKAEKAIRG